MKRMTAKNLKSAKAFVAPFRDLGDATWFIACCRAEEILDECSFKDIAHLIHDGVEACNTLAAVQEWLNTMREREVEAAEEDEQEQVEQQMLEYINAQLHAFGYVRGDAE